MPYVDIGNNTISANVVSGGTELFSRLVARNFDTTVVTIPWQTTVHDNKQYIQQIRELIEEHNIDLILSNNIKAVCLYALRSIGTPILHITHTNYGLFTANETLASMVDRGHSMFAVSRYNKAYFDDRSDRLNQPKVNFAGILPPAYCQYDLPVNTQPNKRIITVGRSNSYKHPFTVHSMVKKTGYAAKVITSVGADRDSIEYYERNKHLPHELKLPHEEVMQMVTDSAASVITCTKETFGITALESLSVGTPIIIRADVTGNHASAEIATDDSQFVMIRKNTETRSALDKLERVDRVAIKQMTQDRYNQRQWVKTFENAFDKTIDVYTKHTQMKQKHASKFFTF
jgi:glycosyltransferase involved in cell wall biosynthesis